MNLQNGQSIEFLAMLFEPLADVVFCVKNLECVYESVNTAFVIRAGAASRAQMIGRRASDYFSSELAAGYDAQDRDVFREGQAVIDQLEQITNSDGSVGWYLASKFPLKDSVGQIVGLVGISQDLHTPNDSELELSNLTQVVDYIRHNLEQPLRVEQLAGLVNLSVEQLDRRMKKVFRLSTKKYIMKSRLEKASTLLSHSECSLAEIASRSGFSDQSAFTRQFKTSFLVTPATFRNQASQRN
jgi:PAS domain S-box-containing protein